MENEKLKKIDIRIEKARSLLKKLSNDKTSYIKGKIGRARRKARFKVGDIIHYSPWMKPLLVTSIGCYDSGEPYYNGLEIRNQRLTRNRRSSCGHGTEAPYVNGLGKRDREHDWKKIGDCTELHF